MGFILASQTNQLFYVDDLTESRWSIGLSTELRNISPHSKWGKAKILKKLNAISKYLVYIDDSKGIRSYAHNEIDVV